MTWTHFPHYWSFMWWSTSTKSQWNWSLMTIIGQSISSDLSCLDIHVILWCQCHACLCLGFLHCIALTGELWGVYYENFGENWLCNNRTTLYIFFVFSPKNPTLCQLILDLYLTSLVSHSAINTIHLGPYQHWSTSGPTLISHNHDRLTLATHCRISPQPVVRWPDQITWTLPEDMTASDHSSQWKGHQVHCFLTNSLVQNQIW